MCVSVWRFGEKRTKIGHDERNARTQHEITEAFNNKAVNSLQCVLEWSLVHLCKRRTFISLTHPLTSTSSTQMPVRTNEEIQMQTEYNKIITHCLRCVASVTASRSKTPTEFFRLHYNLMRFVENDLCIVQTISRKSEKTHTKNATKNLSILFSGSFQRPSQHHTIDQLWLDATNPSGIHFKRALALDCE